MRAMTVAALTVVVLAAGCGSSLPAPECDTNPSFAASALTCEAAIAAALVALPADHPPIERMQFLYGSATPCCSRLYPEGEEHPVHGYVVVTYSSDGHREYVPVVWHDEELIAGTPAPY